MKSSVTVVFVGLFALVAGVYFYLQPYQAPRLDKLDPAPMKLLSLEQDDAITWIQIQNKNEKETITLKLEGDLWFIKYPIEYPANELMAEGLVAALSLSKKARRLVREKGWEEYGLKDPAMKIGVETKQSGKKRYLDFGDPSQVGSFVFARWEDEEEYFLLDAQLKNAFNRSVYSLRLKRVFRFPFKDVVKIRFRTNKDEYEISAYDEKWFWMEPIPILGEVLDKEDRDKILSQLIDLNVKDFLDKEKRTAPEMGFSILSPTIKLWKKEGEPEVLQLGDAIATRDSYYGMREGESVFFLISKENVDLLFKSVDEIAAKYLEKGKSEQNLLV